MRLSDSFLRSGGRRQVTNVELFFDLVYVFAITQLAHHLSARVSVPGALATALLLAMVWLLWVYTTWVTNWLDPDRVPVRLLLIVLMLVSLVLSAGLPDAFTERGLWVGGAYALMQIGRSAFAVAGLHGERLRRNFQRILVWCVASGVLAILGGLAHDHIRAVLWIAAIAVDVLGGAVGFYTPGLGRSATTDWTISVDHFAERCQAFILIALGESVVVTGSSLADLTDVTAVQAGAFVVAFAGAAALWWIYFDRSAETAAEHVAGSTDPGRLGFTAYHLVHPIMVAGIIVTAAADEHVLAAPTMHTEAPTAWLVLGGVALFLAGHALFTVVVWRIMPWTRIAAIVVLGLLGLAAPAMPALALAASAAAVAVALAVADRLLPTWGAGQQRRVVTTHAT